MTKNRKPAAGGTGKAPAAAGGAAARRGNNSRMLWVVGVAGAALAILLIVASIKGRGGAAPPAPPGPGAAPEKHEKGSPSAPVTVEMFSDFQCPACRAAHEVLAPLDDTYIKPGKVRFVYKHFAFIGPESERAAEAADCAGEQGRFWAYHDKLFASQAGENVGNFRDERLKGFARDLGLDGEAFDRCLDDGRHRDEVRAETAAGRRLGVRATPTFFINGRKMEGAPRAFDAFAALVDEALAAAPAEGARR